MSNNKWQYAIILDAGSSGTRVYVYKWLRYKYAASSALQPHLPTIKPVASKKVHPGISTFAGDTASLGSAHLRPLFDFALSTIPKANRAETPFFLLATAGMRLLDPPQQQAILDQVCEYTRAQSPFQLPDCNLHIQVIPGETEALYGWLATNYLLGGYNFPAEHDHGLGHHTYGFLDMGGASAQIAFVPNSTETERHAEDLKLVRLRKMDGASDEYRVFLTTWLGFGANQARTRYVEALRAKSSPYANSLPDPCLPLGLELYVDGKAVSASDPPSEMQRLRGTGDFADCLRTTLPLLEKDKPCNDDPCLFGGKHVPAIDFKVNHFIGVSEYWYTTHQIFDMDHDDKAYDLHSYQARVDKFCSQNWAEIAKNVKAQKWGKNVDENIAEEICFKASWLINMLHEGIGVPKSSIDDGNVNGNITGHQNSFLHPFKAVEEIAGAEVSWTLGKAILYSSAQIPSSSDGDLMPVGYGSNAPGVSLPLDFTQPASPALIQQAQQDNLLGNTNSRPLSSPRHASALIFFVLLSAVGLYLFCGRDRRHLLFTRARSFARRRRSRGKRFFGYGPGYEQVGRGDEEAGRPPSNSGNGDVHPTPLFGISSATAIRGSGGPTPAIELAEYPEYHDVDAQASGYATPKGSSLVRNESRDRLFPLRVEARMNRSCSPVVKLSRD